MTQGKDKYSARLWAYMAKRLDQAQAEAIKDVVATARRILPQKQSDEFLRSIEGQAAVLPHQISFLHQAGRPRDGPKEGPGHRAIDESIRRSYEKVFTTLERNERTLALTTDQGSYKRQASSETAGTLGSQAPCASTTYEDMDLMKFLNRTEPMEGTSRATQAQRNLRHLTSALYGQTLKSILSHAYVGQLPPGRPMNQVVKTVKDLYLLSAEEVDSYAHARHIPCGPKTMAEMQRILAGNGLPCLREGDQDRNELEKASIHCDF